MKELVHLSFVFKHAIRCILFLFVVEMVSCTSDSHPQQNHPQLIDSTFQGDTSLNALDSSIDDPFKSGVLNVLITNQLNTYFVYKGMEKGLEFDLLSLYAKARKLKLRFVVIHDLHGVQDSILKYKAHIAAASFALPIDTLGTHTLTEYLYKSDIVLIRRKKSPSIKQAQGPIKAYLIEDGPFVASLIRQNKTYSNIQILPAPAYSTKQSLIEDVANGLIDYTLCDRNEAQMMLAFHPNLNIDEVVVHNLPIVFMVHPRCNNLLADFNQWVSKVRNTSDFRWTVIKYNRFARELRKAMRQTTPKEFATSISHYDPLVKKYSKKVDWDWCLLSALIYQESQYNPRCNSWVGARGLMQVMPRTAYAHGRVRSYELYKPYRNLHAGTAYIQWMQKNYFKEPEISESNRIKFLLASYNAGIGHVGDARALAQKYGYNPNVWDKNVEVMMLAKSKPKYYRDPVCKYGYCRGQEPVTYVKNILTYQKHYRKWVKHMSKQPERTYSSAN